MDWLLKNARMLVALLVASLAVNAGTTLWLLKTEKELTRVERAYGNQPEEASKGMQGQDVLSILNKMNQCLTRLEDIAERKEQAEKKVRAAEKKFYGAPQLPMGAGKGYGPSDVH